MIQLKHTNCLKFISYVEFNSELFNTYKKLFSSRKNCKALRLGNFQIELADESRDIFGFSRTYEDENAFAYLRDLIKIK